MAEGAAVAEALGLCAGDAPLHVLGVLVAAAYRRAYGTGVSVPSVAILRHALALRHITCYERRAFIGNGTYGSVFCVAHRHEDDHSSAVCAACARLGNRYALKKIKPPPDGDVSLLTLRELEALWRCAHANVAELVEVVWGMDVQALSLVMPYYPHNVAVLVKAHRRGLPTAFLAPLARGLFAGLAHMHALGYVHRDVKPDNLLLSSEGVLKLCDFGLARSLAEWGPEGEARPISGCVSARWYRAPEVLLQAPAYDAAIDVWSAGVTLAELVRGKPLFTASTEMEQVHIICAALGSPTRDEWPEFETLARRISLQYRVTEAKDWTTLLVRGASPDLAALLRQCVQFSPVTRISAYEALDTNFLKDAPESVPAEVLPAELVSDS